MRKLQKSRISIILTLLALTSFLTVISSFPVVLGGPDIPEESEKSSWHWGVDVGDELYFEVQFTLKNMTSGEIVRMFRDIWIYNISSIENMTMEWLGIQEFSVVNATRCYYDPDTMEIFAWSDPEEYAIFNYNETDATHYRYRAGFSGIPQLLPINNSAIELDILAPIINETMYSPLGTMIFNQFDSYEYNLGANSLRFDNSTDGYYAYGEYYGNNGTLKYAEVSMLADMDGPMIINATLQRVFNFDITDEVEWGVSIGSSVFYDYYEGSSGFGEAYDLKLTITNITDQIVPTPYNSFNFEEDIPMVFQIVFADLFLWNGTDYELDGPNFVMGAANNFYPMLFEGGPPPESFMIMPTSTTKEDLEFLWNPDKLRIIGADPLDTIEINDNTELELIISSSFSSEYIRAVVDKTTGFYKSFLGLMGDIYYYEQKDMTLIDWYYEPGDHFYYKVNEGDTEDRIIRGTVLGTFGLFVNMTLFELDTGGLFTIPSDQPELQFFSAILADFYVWNATSEAWEFDASEEVFGMANIYWPLSPLALGMSYGFPMLYPMNIQGSDFSGLFGFYSTVYDDITYGSNFVTLVNTTLDRQLNFHFDSTSGMLTFLGGWVNQPGGDPTDWDYTSVYPLNRELLGSGMIPVNYENNFDLNIDIAFNLNISSSPFEYLYAMFPFNPVHVPLPNGTALCFIDQITTHPSYLSGNITMTINLPLSINLATTEVYLFAWNVTGLSTWEIAPPDAYEINLTSNSIIISFPPFTSDSFILAMSYKAAPPETPETPGIPGYDPFLLILGLALTATILVKVKNIKKSK